MMFGNVENIDVFSPVIFRIRSEGRSFSFLTGSDRGRGFTLKPDLGLPFLWSTT
jgi:hypothetical protein